MTTWPFRRLADYGGVANSLLCLVHCAVGPLVLAWLGAQQLGFSPEYWELLFVGLSGLLVALAANRQTTSWLRLALWLLFGIFAAATLLAERWPILEMVQLAASFGLIGAHLLNQHYKRCCPTTPSAMQRKAGG